MTAVGLSGLWSMRELIISLLSCHGVYVWTIYNIIVFVTLSRTAESDSSVARNTQLVEEEDGPE